MFSWHPHQYLQFEEERTRPCRDLASQIRLAQASNVIDLGCGPGNSTAVLAERWPSAKITGLDSSLDMLRKARQRETAHEWFHGTITEWADSADDEYNVVFSNAALHWVTDHATVFPRLLARVTAGGALAIQMPANLNEPAHRIMRELAASSAWRERFPPDGVREWFAHDVPFYYDVLSPLAKTLNIWETKYIHLLPGVAAITEWYRATGLRPFLECLRSEEAQNDFLSEYTNALCSEYRARPSGQVLFPFRRLFLIASR